MKSTCQVVRLSHPPAQTSVRNFWPICLFSVWLSVLSDYGHWNFLTEYFCLRVCFCQTGCKRAVSLQQASLRSYLLWWPLSASTCTSLGLILALHSNLMLTLSSDHRVTSHKKFLKFHWRPQRTGRTEIPWTVWNFLTAGILSENVLTVLRLSDFFRQNHFSSENICQSLHRSEVFRQKSCPSENAKVVSDGNCNHSEYFNQNVSLSEEISQNVHFSDRKLKILTELCISVWNSWQTLKLGRLVRRLYSCSHQAWDTGPGRNGLPLRPERWT